MGNRQCISIRAPWNLWSLFWEDASVCLFSLYFRSFPDFWKFLAHRATRRIFGKLPDLEIKPPKRDLMPAPGGADR